MLVNETILESNNQNKDQNEKIELQMNIPISKDYEIFMEEFVEMIEKFENDKTSFVIFALPDRNLRIDLYLADTKKETYDLLDSLTSHLIKIGGSTNA